MKVRVAAIASLSWRDGHPVWDDPLRHRQFALTDISLDVVRWFAAWRPLDDVLQLSARHHAVAQRLLERDVLVAHGSAEHDRERLALEAWDAWGPAARQYHYASRTLEESRFASPEAALELMQHRAASDSPPPIERSRPGRRIPLPDVALDDERWQQPGLPRALQDRRTARAFTARPVALEDLAAVVHLAAGFFGVFETPTGPEAYKSSPAAGGLHPTELYVRARRVDGLAPGTYHYSALEGAFVPVGDERVDIDAAPAFGGQDWPAQSPVLLLHTAVVERNQWRYQVPRGYRDVLLGLGHVTQTVQLLAAARGLGAGLATAIRDDVLEAHLECDGMRELVLGVTALGHPAARTAPPAVEPEWLVRGR